jgi:hypothetical protein
VFFNPIHFFLVPSFGPGEKQEVLQSLRDLTADLRTIKQYTSEVFTRTYSIEQKVLAGAVGGGQGQVQQPGAAAGLDGHTRAQLDQIQVLHFI